MNELINAIRENKVTDVRNLLNAGADPNAQGHIGWTALMNASRRGHTKIVQELLKAGANPNVYNNIITKADIRNALIALIFIINQI